MPPSPVNADQSPWTVALDLEGTLISNAVSQFPRPGLHTFFLGLQRLHARLVFFTSVSEERARVILQTLAGEGSIPSWAAALPFVAWSGPHKDLRLVPDATLARVLLVDDMPAVLTLGQEAQWIRVTPFEPPFDVNDGELARVLAMLQGRCRA